MKKDKIVKAAEGAKKDGYEVMYSLLMVKNKVRVYHVVSIEDVIRYGHWLPATVRLAPDLNGKLGPVVQATNVLPDNAISKTEALRKYK